MSAKNQLESYAFSMKSTFEDDKIKDKVPEEDREKVISKCKEVINWLDKNQTAEKEEFDHQQKEIEGVCTPIVTKLYQAGGAPDGGMPGGIPGGMPGGFPGGASAGASSAGGSGPTIEEVD